jgi:hypothetical protein
MSNLEFISSMTQTLAWPTFSLAVLFYYRSKLSEFALEMLGAKIQVKLIKEGEAPKSNTTSPTIKSESAHYKLYSNGLLIQVIKLRVLPDIENLELVYPVAFPNEILSIQSIGHDIVWPEQASLGGCRLKIQPSNYEREIQLKISGI